MVKELRRQVQSEKKRAEQAEKHLDDVLGMGDANVYTHSEFFSLHITQLACFASLILHSSFKNWNRRF